MRGVDRGRALARVRAQVLASLDALPRRVGRYEILGELGRGGMGIVYDALDPRLGRRVALKVMHPRIEAACDAEQLARFEAEMRATAQLFHPHLVTILDAGAEREPERMRPYYVMERICGESLEERLARKGTLSRSEGLAIARAIASAIAAAHAHGLVHRDLKPANVLLDAEGTPRVADFGLCSMRSARAATGLVGSAHYVSPEQILGREVGPSADLFALGGILVRMFAGDEPFHAATLNAHVARILGDRPDGLERLAPPLRALAERLLSKDPARRPASADAVARELETLQRDGHGRRMRRVALTVSALIGGTLVAVAMGARERLVTLDAQARAARIELESQQRAMPEGPATLAPVPVPSVRDYELAGARNRLRVAALRYNAAATALDIERARVPGRWLAWGIGAHPLHALGDVVPLAIDARPASSIDDTAGLLEPDERDALRKDIALLRDATGIDVRIVAVRGGPGTLEDRAGAYFDRHGIGADAGRGLLFFYDLEARALRIELGHDLERYFPDSAAGMLIREHARYLFDANDPAFSLLLTLRMIESRMVRAFFAGDFDPAHVPSGQSALYARGGAGASGAAALGTRVLHAFSPAPAHEAEPAATPEAAYQGYLRWLASGRFDPAARLFTPASRAFLARWPMTPAYLDWLLTLELGQHAEIAHRGDRALLYSTTDPYVSPQFLTRTDEGWQLDLVADLRHVVRVRGGAYFWTLVERDGEALRELQDLIVEIDGFARLSRSDNRPFGAIPR